MMLFDRTVTIQSPTTADVTYDSEGISSKAWTAVQTSERANKQVLDGELAFNDYGISTVGISNIFFLKTSTSTIESGRIIDDKTYEVVRIEPYFNHVEAIVRPVVE